MTNSPSQNHIDEIDEGSLEDKTRFAEEIPNNEILGICELEGDGECFC